MTNIVIVGAGFSGTLLALHLLRRCPPSVKVTLVERSAQFGRGSAYSTGNPNHLLNVPAGKMSAFHDQSSDFLEWLQQTPDYDLPQTITEHSFVPRRLYGAYVRHLLSREMKTPYQAGRLKLVHGDVVGIDCIADDLEVRLDRRRAILADLAVLAVGNFPPEPPAVDDPAFFDTDLYRPDPWSPDAFSDLDPADPVLLIGTGLTTVDAVVSLLDQGHSGTIYGLSRRGLVPHRHVNTPSPTPRRDSVPTSLVELVRFMRREGMRARVEGASWQAIVDELRPFTLDIWAEMCPADRARFLRHLRPWWEIHRHRMAPAVADRIDAAVKRGQLQIYAGRIQSFRKLSAGIEVTYRTRVKQIIKRLSAARVVNCSGPNCDYDRIAHPLIRSLLQSGMVRPDPLGVGLDVTSSCALKNRAGAISGKLFAIGPVTKGAFWEMTAVPDIRRQSEFLAGHLSALVKNIPPRRRGDQPDYSGRAAVSHSAKFGGMVLAPDG